MNMIEENKNQNIVLYISMILVMLLDLTLCVKNYTVLYGDGSYIFQLILSNGSFDIHNEYNFLPNIILKQGFIVAALKVGVTDISILAKAYTFGCVIWRVLFFAGSMYFCVKAKNNNYLSLTIVMIALNMITTGMFTMMTYIMGTACFWFLFMFWLFEKKGTMNQFWKSVVFIVSLLNIGMAPISAILSTILIFLIIFKIYKKELRLNIYISFNIFFYALSILICGSYLINPRDSQNRSQYISSILNMSSVLLVILALLFVAYFISYFISNKKVFGKERYRKESSVILYRLSVSIQILAGTMCMTWVILLADWIVKKSYITRCMNLISPVAFALFILVIYVFQLKMKDGIYKWGAVMMLTATLVFSCMFTTGYGRYLDELFYVTNSNEGIVDGNRTYVTNDDYCFGWNIPLESIYTQAFHGKKNIDSVIVQSKEWINWEPFDSYNIDTYPDFSRYSVWYNKEKLSVNKLYQDKFLAEPGSSIPFGATGVYYNEGNQHWISNEVMIPLRAEEIKKKGLQFDFFVPLQLYKYTNKQDVNIQISVNGSLVTNSLMQKTNDPKMQKIIIQNSQLPDSEDGIYQISIKTDAVFNPKEVGESDDNRNLSLLLKYIGPVGY